jgi:hypothetical protein
LIIFFSFKGEISREIDIFLRKSIIFKEKWFLHFDLPKQKSKRLKEILMHPHTPHPHPHTLKTTETEKYVTD